MCEKRSQTPRSCRLSTLSLCLNLNLIHKSLTSGKRSPVLDNMHVNVIYPSTSAATKPEAQELHSFGRNSIIF